MVYTRSDGNFLRWFTNRLQTMIDTMLYTHCLDLRHVLVEEHGFYWQLWEKDKHIQ